ncbi:MAG: hypothetical protein LH606_22265 [Cytophagaceae bacterium]|nr:hypothetical protein [Cytophagaceae bacterium]
MKKLTFFLLAISALLFTRCGVNKQIAEAKALGDCKFNINSADSVYLAGVDVRQFRSMRDFDLTRYPQLGLAVLRKNVPLDVRINLGVTNPTNRLAAINQLEYRILLKGTELFNGFLNQRIEVAPGGGQTSIPIRLNANAYSLLTDANTRDSFLELVRNLAGAEDAKATRLTIKIKPTLALGNKQVNYPGYITIDQDVTNKILLGK